MLNTVKVLDFDHHARLKELKNREYNSVKNGILIGARYSGFVKCTLSTYVMMIVQLFRWNGHLLPDELHQILVENPMQYGTGNLTTNEIHPTMVVWEVNHKANTVGYVWTQKHQLKHYEFWKYEDDLNDYIKTVSVAIPSNMRNMGIGTSALIELEKILCANGVNAVYAQVNHKPQLNAIQILIKNEYEHILTPSNARFFLPNKYLERGPGPFFFRKMLLPCIDHDDENLLTVQE